MSRRLIKFFLLAESTFRFRRAFDRNRYRLMFLSRVAIKRRTAREARFTSASFLIALLLLDRNGVVSEGVESGGGVEVEAEFGGVGLVGSCGVLAPGFGLGAGLL